MPDVPGFELSPRAAAKRAGVHEDTLKRWAVDGKIRAYRTPGGWWRFAVDDIDALVAGTYSPESAA
jgi:excisionase family DNA binding protein